MGTGLSPLQRQILEILPEYHAENGYIIEGMRVRVILRELTLENTAANNASVSRSLLRLCQRDLAYSFKSFGIWAITFNIVARLKKKPTFTKVVI